MSYAGDTTHSGNDKDQVEGERWLGICGAGAHSVSEGLGNGGGESILVTLAFGSVAESFGLSDEAR
jgi:hypothetical protein